MTISTTTIKNSYSGNDSTDAFSYTFKITADSEMQVIIRSSTGTETVKTLTTHYTVSGAGNASGGTVTFTSGNIPATGETVILRRNTSQTQGMDLIDNDPMAADTIETAHDKSMALIQELQEQVDRSFKVSRTNTISSAEFTEGATDRASKTLGFDSSGDLTTVADFLPSGGDSAQFKYSTTTADADPGSGYIRFNNSTLGSATAAYVDDAEINGTDVSAWLLSFDDVTGNASNRGRIRVTKSNTLDTWHVWKITGASTDASGYVKLSLTYIDGNGTLANDDKVFLSFVASGEDGAIPGYYYKFDTGTTDADPGAGEIRFNNGTYASATAIYIDDADANGATTSADVLTWDDSTSTIKGYLHIVDINDSSTYARFSITGSSTDASGYNKLAVTHLVSNNTFSAADELSVHFTRQGDKGDTGATGSTGSTGSTGATGASGTNSQLSMTWSSSTSDADPGAGKIAFNHATLSSVSILYVDDTDDASADISGYVQSWDDVSNSTARGIVTITKEGTASTYAIFKVSGAVTDASGYTKVPVTHVVSNGSFSNTDGVGVHFGYSGADSAVTASSTTTLTNKTLTSPKINEDVVCSATSTELNKLDGATVTTTELNYSDLATLGTTAASKVFTADANNLTKITGAVYLEEATLTFDATQDWDVRASPVAKVTLTNNVTFDAPTNPTTGQFISIVCIQDGTGSRTIAWNAVFEFTGDEAPTATTTANKGDMFNFRYNGSKWLEVGRNLNLTLS